MTAILLIDLQQEFFDNTGILQDRCIPRAPILQHIHTLVDYGRRHRYPIIWIRAEYDPLNQGIALTHNSGSRPCCVKGSSLAQLHPGLPIQPEDPIFTKQYYSAFVETDLETYLQDIDHLIIGGVTLKNCVYFTAQDAHRLGYTVTIIPECTAMSNMKHFESTLKDFEPIANIQSIRGLKIE